MTYPRRQPAHSPAKMTRAYNVTTALSKIDITPIEKLTPDLIASISRTHKVSVDELQARLDARKARLAA